MSALLLQAELGIEEVLWQGNSTDTSNTSLDGRGYINPLEDSRGADIIVFAVAGAPQ